VHREDARSVLTLGEWARPAGIDGRLLHAWNVNLARGGSGLRPKTTEGRGTRRVKLAELVPMASTSRSTPYVVRVGQVALEADATFDEVTLLELVAVLRTC
jgi:hypothetical protein